MVIKNNLRHHNDSLRYVIRFFEAGRDGRSRSNVTFGRAQKGERERERSLGIK